MGTCSHALYQHLSEDLQEACAALNHYDLYAPNTKHVSRPEAGPREFACLHLLNNVFKKLVDAKKVDADSKALDKFLLSNSLCNRRRGIDEVGSTTLVAIALGEFRSIYHNFWFDGPDYWLSYQAISDGLATGPGVSIKASGTSFYHKIAAGPMTASSQFLVDLYMGSVSRNPTWMEAEEIRSTQFGNPILAESSKLSFVPKSDEISRTICVEPNLNMLFQKGIGALIEEKLRERFDLDLTFQQSRNRDLAKIGSASGALATIDLSSASDTISTQLVREITPPYVMGWLDTCRTKSVLLPDGVVEPLHMISSMGNAFTFPLQTLIFSSVILGCYKALDIEPRRWPRGRPDGSMSGAKYHANWGCNGDDLIVTRESYNLVVDVLRRLGFMVNAEKSFNEGAFRESCGEDFFSGVNVRPVFIKRLATRQDRYVAINRLNAWSARLEVPLTRAVGYLLEGLEFLPVPPWDNDDSGIKVPLYLAGKRFPSSFGTILYKRYVPRGSRASLLDVQSRPPKGRFKGLFHNPPGIILAAVASYLRDGDISLRIESPYYSKRRGVSLCWDWHPPYDRQLDSHGWCRWETFYTAVNLSRS